MKHANRLAGTLLLLLGLAPSGRADDNPYQDLLRRLPDSTNAVVAVDVQSLRKTLGIKPGSTLMASHMSSMPIAADKFVLGAHLDMSERRHLWSVAMCQLLKKMPLEDIAKLENEPIDKIGDYNAVASMRNAYFIDLGSDVLCAASPMNRQMIKKWLQFQKTNQLAAMPQYLLDATNPSEPALMVLAADLTDSLDPVAIHRGLNGSKVLADRKRVDYSAIGKLLAKAQGVTLTIRPGEPLYGELTVHFNGDTDPVKTFSKPLLIEILEHTGISIPDFDDWQARVRQRSIGIHGNLSLNGLRKIGTLVRTPAPPPEAADMGNYASLDPTQRAIQASTRYFKNVTQILDDLKADKTRKTKELASWYDRYADQIDKLPILDVDQQLVGYAAAMSEHLRAFGASLKGIDLQVGYL